MKILVIEVKECKKCEHKFLLCQHKLHMKLTTSLCSVIQRCQMHESFVFLYILLKSKRKDNIRRNINSTEKKCSYVKSMLLF